MTRRNRNTVPNHTRPIRSLIALANAKIGHYVNLTLNVDRTVAACSVRKLSRYCLIAQALRALGSDITGICVTADTIKFNYAGKRFCFDMPAIGRAYVIAFDDGEEFKPFSLPLKNGMVCKAIERTREYLQRAEEARVRNQAAGTSVRKQEAAARKDKPRSRKSIGGVRLSVRRYAGLRVIEKV